MKKIYYPIDSVVKKLPKSCFKILQFSAFDILESNNEIYKCYPGNFEQKVRIIDGIQKC